VRSCNLRAHVLCSSMASGCTRVRFWPSMRKMRRSRPSNRLRKTALLMLCSRPLLLLTRPNVDTAPRGSSCRQPHSWPTILLQPKRTSGGYVREPLPMWHLRGDRRGPAEHVQDSQAIRNGNGGEEAWLTTRWPIAGSRTTIGTDVTRIDSPLKVSGSRGLIRLTCKRPECYMRSPWDVLMRMQRSSALTLARLKKSPAVKPSRSSRNPARRSSGQAMTLWR